MPASGPPERAPVRPPGSGAWLKPGVPSLFLAMGLLLPFVAVLSGMTRRGTDLPGTDYFVFPFLHHGHGELWRPFFPGSWAANFLVTAWLLSVPISALSKRPPRPLVTSPLFFYLWLPLTGILEVAADTMVPLFTGRFGVPFRVLVIAVNAGFALATAGSWLFSRGAEGEW